MRMRRAGDAGAGNREPGAVAPMNPLDRLEATLDGAERVPLTEQVRVPRGELDGAVGEVRDRADGPLRVRALVADLERLAENARPIPLTGQVRIDPAELRRVIASLRETGCI